MSYKFPANATASPTFIKQLLEVKDASQVASSLTNLFIQDYKKENKKKLSITFNTTILKQKGFSENALTLTSQFLSQMLKGAGFTVSCGFPWADAEHTEYLSTDKLYITISK
jgi:hypothetical protein